MQPGKSVFFVSDVHLGVPDHASSLERERKLVKWLDEISPRAESIHIVGDLFDFWFEYRHAVPRGFVRILGKLAELRDQGIEVHIYTGNHDFWLFDYFPQELGIPVHYDIQRYSYNGKKFLVGHGDGIGPGDHGYKFLKKIFTNPVCQWLFARLHPNLGIGLALYWSRKSRQADAQIDESFKGESEAQVIYAREVLNSEDLDYFVFGHRHWPTKYALNEQAHLLNLGDWITHFTYAEFDGQDATVKHWEQ